MFIIKSLIKIRMNEIIFRAFAESLQEFSTEKTS